MYGCGGLDSNQRPLAYEASELTNCSTPQYISERIIFTKASIIINCLLVEKIAVRALKFV